MRQHNKQRAAQSLAVALGTALAAGAASSADDLKAYTATESTVSIGVGSVTQASRRFGQYTGLTEERAYALLGFDLLKRDDATGTWQALKARNLGLENRELQAAFGQQGQWGILLDYSQIVRNDPLQVTTSLGGFGSPVVAIGGAALSTPRLKTSRDRLAIGLTRTLPANFDAELRYRQDIKDGARLFGRGTAQFLAEPIDSRTEQVDATISYTGKRLQMAGGYNGSVYRNRPQVLDVSTGADIALPPDNSSHQLFLTGGYSLAQSTRATFKLAYGRATQDDSFFIAPDFPGNTRSNLDGRVDTTIAQLGISARPTPNLSLLANLRYDDRDDKTPRFQFLTPSTGRDGFNTPFSRTATVGKVEASYRLPLDVRLTAGVERDERKRNVLSIRQASWREKNDETSYRVELRRSMSATLNGAVSYVHSDRGGSEYLPANNNTAADFIDPVHFADRNRRKLRASLDWTPTEAVSLQALFDDSRDTYDGRPLGPQSGKARFYSLDGTVSLSDNWQATVWLSNDQNRIQQATITGSNTTLIAAQTWQTSLRSRGKAHGVGIAGRTSEKLQIGIDYMSEQTDNSHVLDAVVPAEALLPDITSRHSQVQTYVRYALRESMGLRLDYAYDRYKTDDWTWNGWVYADGSTVLLTPSETGSFIGLSMYFMPRW